jgi:hypothetical protein
VSESTYRQKIATMFNTCESKNMETKAQRQFPDLLTEKRPTVDTATAAHWLSRQPQTLRVYALTGHPIRPVRFNGRLAWPVSEIKRAMGVTA